MRARLSAKSRKQTLDEQLLKAIRSRNMFAVMNALDLGASAFGKRLLLRAAAKHNLEPELAKEIINSSDMSFYTPLSLACRLNEPAIAKLLISSYADVNIVHPVTGYTPLHEAILWNRPAICRMLYDAGADIHAKSKDGTTPLDLIMQSNNSDLASAFYGIKDVFKLKPIDLILPGSAEASAHALYIAKICAKLKLVVGDDFYETVLLGVFQKNNVEMTKVILRSPVNLDMVMQKLLKKYHEAEIQQFESGRLIYAAYQVLISKQGKYDKAKADYADELAKKKIETELECIRYAVNSYVDVSSDRFARFFSDIEINLAKKYIEAYPADNLEQLAFYKAAFYVAIRVKNEKILDLLLGIRKLSDFEVVGVVGAELPLICAVRTGSLKIVERIVRAGAKMDVTGADGKETALMIAINNRYVDIVTFFIQEGCGWKNTTRNSLNILAHICEKGDLEMLQVFLGDKYFLINVLNEHNKSLLDIVLENDSIAEKDKLAVVKCLLLAGIDVKIGRSTKLFHAIELNNLELVKLLIDNGVDVNDKFLCTTALVHALEINANDEIIKLLLPNNTTINTPQPDSNNTPGLSPFLLAVKFWRPAIIRLLLKANAINDINTVMPGRTTPLLTAMEKNDPEITDLLLESGADPKLDLIYNYTPLLLAIRQGNVRLVEKFIQMGVMINGRYGVLIEAVQVSNVEIVKMLIKAGADTELTYGKFTALHYAAESNHTEIINLLIDAGADPRKVVPQMANLNSTKLLHEAIGVINMTPADLAGKNSARMGSKASLTIFEKFIARYSKSKVEKDFYEKVLYEAILCGNTHVVSALLKAGADANYYNEGVPLLWSAIAFKKSEIMKLLIEHGADVNAFSPVTDMTPLMRAVDLGSDVLTRLLLEARCNASASNSHGSTALHIAASKGHASIVSKLLFNVFYDKTTTINATNNKNETALITALSESHIFTATLLINNGADVNIISEAGASALSLAIGLGDEELIQLLIRKGADLTQKINGKSLVQFAKHHSIKLLIENEIAKKEARLLTANIKLAYAVLPSAELSSRDIEMHLHTLLEIGRLESACAKLPGCQPTLDLDCATHQTRSVWLKKINDVLFDMKSALNKFGLKLYSSATMLTISKRLANIEKDNAHPDCLVILSDVYAALETFAAKYGKDHHMYKSVMQALRSDVSEKPALISTVSASLFSSALPSVVMPAQPPSYQEVMQKEFEELTADGNQAELTIFRDRRQYLLKFANSNPEALEQRMKDAEMQFSLNALPSVGVFASPQPASAAAYPVVAPQLSLGARVAAVSKPTL